MADRKFPLEEFEDSMKAFVASVKETSLKSDDPEVKKLVEEIVASVSKVKR